MSVSYYIKRRLAQYLCKLAEFLCGDIVFNSDISRENDILRTENERLREKQIRAGWLD